MLQIWEKMFVEQCNIILCESNKILCIFIHAMYYSLNQQVK